MESIRVFIGKIPELCRKNSVKEDCSSCGYRGRNHGIYRNCHRGGYFALISEFYGTAFSSSEQGAIVAQDVGNEDNPYCNTEGGNDTRDNVYLLSIGEVINPEYGFFEDYRAYSVSRRVQASDYAYARGAYTNSGSYEGNTQNHGIK